MPYKKPTLEEDDEEGRELGASGAIYWGVFVSGLLMLGGVSSGIGLLVKDGECYLVPGTLFLSTATFLILKGLRVLR